MVWYKLVFFKKTVPTNNNWYIIIVFFTALLSQELLVTVQAKRYTQHTKTISYKHKVEYKRKGPHLSVTVVTHMYTNRMNTHIYEVIYICTHPYSHNQTSNLIYEYMWKEEGSLNHSRTNTITVVVVAAMIVLSFNFSVGAFCTSAAHQQRLTPVTTFYRFASVRSSLPLDFLVVLYFGTDNEFARVRISIWKFIPFRPPTNPME